jgi:ketosteroid isomerase-like protein
MVPPGLRNSTVKAAIDAFQRGDRAAWSALFEEGAELFDDGSPRSFREFTADALGHERFTSFDRVSADGLEVVGDLGEIHRLDVGQVE